MIAGLIVCVCIEAVAVVVLAVLCGKLYGDVVGMARSMAGMPPVQQGKSRVISPYKRRKGGGDA